MPLIFQFHFSSQLAQNKEKFVSPFFELQRLSTNFNCLVQPGVRSIMFYDGVVGINFSCLALQT